MLKQAIRALAASPARRSHSWSRRALAQAPVEVSFYYPVAVGGPITKIIDGYAADFEKENPGIKLKPIYSGTYQDIDHQGADGGEERRAAGDVDPAVDRHVHADRRGRDRARSTSSSRRRRTRRGSRASIRRSWRTARPAARPGAFRSSARRSSSTTTRRCSRKRASTRTGRRRTGRRWLEYAQKLTKRDASGKVTQWGVQIPSSGFPYWLFQALAIENGVNLMNAAGTRDLLRQARK